MQYIKANLLLPTCGKQFIYVFIFSRIHLTVKSSQLSHIRACLSLLLRGVTPRGSLVPESPWQRLMLNQRERQRCQPLFNSNTLPMYTMCIQLLHALGLGDGLGLGLGLALALGRG